MNDLSKRSLTCVLFILSIGYSQDDSPMVVNINCDHNSINTIFVVVDPTIPDYYSHFYQSSWENALLKAGYNIITRSKIDAILDEQGLAMAGLTNEQMMEKIGKLIEADGILFYYKNEWNMDFTSESMLEKKKSYIDQWGDSFGEIETMKAYHERIKLVDVATGEICFSVHYIFDLTGVSAQSYEDQILNRLDTEFYILKYWHDSDQIKRGKEYLKKHYPVAFESLSGEN